MTTKSTRAMKWAHYLYKNRNYDNRIQTWQGALTNAWYFVRFQDELSRSVIRFSFFKKDGSIREAIGTTNLLLIPNDKRPKGTQTTVNCQFSTINYFDLQKHEWRSFNIRSFIGFVDIWRITHIDKPVLVPKREK